MPQGSAMRLVSAPPLLLLLHLLLSPLLLVFSPPALAQQSQPLMGQGVDPVSLGVIPTSQAPFPVYVSISLEQLSDVNELDYTFNGVFTVVVTWRDPSVNLTGNVNLINFLGGDSVANQNSQAQNCTKWATIAGGTNVGDCASATANPGSSCSRPCFMATGYACCDNIWIPSISISNILSISQDNIATDELWLYGGTVGPANQDWSAVYRVVRVQGQFTNDFDFQKFPFDQQLLKFQMSPVPPANFYIVPSMRGLAFLGPYGFVFQNSSKAFAPQIPFRYYHQSFGKTAVTGWTIINASINLCCGTGCNSTQTAQTAANDKSKAFDIMNNTMAIQDPQQYFMNNVWPYPATWQTQTYSESGGLTCAMCIPIKRNYSFYVVNDLIPVLLNALLAFTVVFARPEDLDVRLSTLVTLFLALVAVQFVIAGQLPRTEYTTAFGALVLASYCLIVALILESLIVFYISALEESFKRKKLAKEMRMQSRLTAAAVEAAKAEDEEEEEREAGQEGGMRLTEGEQEGGDIEAEADGRPPPQADTEPLGPKTSSRTSSKKAADKFSIFRPFMINEEKLLSMVGGKEVALHVASWVDNISLLILGLGFIVAVIVIFCVMPGASMDCY